MKGLEWDPQRYSKAWLERCKEPVYTLGTRGSCLAVAQAQYVAGIMAEHGYKTQIETITTTGDKLLDRPVEQLGGKGAFVKELDQALLEGRIDLAVHSLKDLPTELPRGLEILSVTQREDPRDVLVLPKGQRFWDPRLPVGCGSHRRAIQLRYLQPDANIVPIRGNVLTRLEMLDQGKYGALVLAAAGLKRLGLESRISRYFSTDEMLPAAGQGTLAVVWKREPVMTPISRCFTELPYFVALAEREFLRVMGGGCGSPSTAYAWIRPDDLMVMEAFHCESDSSRPRRLQVMDLPHEYRRMAHYLAKELRNGR